MACIWFPNHLMSGGKIYVSHLDFDITVVELLEVASHAGCFPMLGHGSPGPPLYESGGGRYARQMCIHLLGFLKNLGSHVCPWTLGPSTMIRLEKTIVVAMEGSLATGSDRVNLQ